VTSATHMSFWMIGLLNMVSPSPSRPGSPGAQ
jgi:hypothetical protein